jgi:nucleotide-binding universal stress UspA family protein
VFLNVIEREKVAMRRGTGYQKSEEVRLKEKTNIRFIDWAENLYERGMEVGAYIVVGSLVKQVILAVEKEAADLIVIGRPKKGKLEQLYSGSDVEEIIRRSMTPVLIYKYLSTEGLTSEHPFARPLYTTDLLETGHQAVKKLEGIKAITQEIHVIHVVDETNLKGTSAMAVQKARKETRKKLEEICDTLVAKGMHARAHVYVGNTASQIERAARECQATMIIAGTSGKGSLKERWIGSTTRILAEKSIFPTLLIPSESI